jgi:quercetin dioxygenase-like cupin family protein
MSENIFSYLEDLKGEPTAHLSGLKKVFLANEDTDSNLTQFAYGVFEPGESCPKHSHPTMIECFYFISGEGIYTVGDMKVKLQPGTFLKIPENIDHELVNDGTENLEFVYFGVAI